jgi:hypothetical protein
VDRIEQLIGEIREELDELTDGKWPASRWVFGKLKKNEHATHPRIEWEEHSGLIGDGKLVGSNTGNISGDAETFTVTIWHSTRENCRNTLHNLILAARQKAYGPNVKFGAYEWREDAHTQTGRKLAVRVTLIIGVGTEVMPEAEVETHDHEIEVNGQPVC